jgi:hypothetical protein
VPLSTEEDPDISIKRGGAVFFKEKKSDFKIICFKKHQKIPRRNSKRNLENLVQRKMTRTKLQIFWLKNLAKNKFFVYYTD